MNRATALLALVLVMSLGVLPAAADAGEEGCACDVETGECVCPADEEADAADYDLDDPCPCGCGHTLESCTCPAGHCGIEMP